MILTLYARAPLLCVWTLCVCAPHPQCVVRATEVSLAQTEIAFITLYEPASTTARVLSRLAVAAHHATTHGLGPPVATNQWGPRAKRGRAVARGQTARLSAGKVLSRVHCDHLDHGPTPTKNRVCGASRDVQKVQKVSRRCPEGVQKMSRRCPEGWKRMWERLESPLQVAF